MHFIERAVTDLDPRYTILGIRCALVETTYLAAEFLSSGELDRNLQRSISLYRDKRDYMLELLERYMPSGVSWTLCMASKKVFMAARSPSPAGSAM